MGGRGQPVHPLPLLGGIMRIKCISKFSSSSGIFAPGDIVSGNENLVKQLLNESPASFMVMAPENEEAPQMDIQDKKMKRGITRKAD